MHITHFNWSLARATLLLCVFYLFQFHWNSVCFCLLATHLNYHLKSNKQRILTFRQKLRALFPAFYKFHRRPWFWRFQCQCKMFSGIYRGMIENTSNNWFSGIFHDSTSKICHENSKATKKHKRKTLMNRTQSRKKLAEKTLNEINSFVFFCNFKLRF